MLLILGAAWYADFSSGLIDGLVGQLVMMLRVGVPLFSRGPAGRVAVAQSAGFLLPGSTTEKAFAVLLPLLVVAILMHNHLFSMGYPAGRGLDPLDKFVRFLHCR